MLLGMELLTGLFSSLGLSGAAGLNAYIPLLLVGILSRLGLMELAQPFDMLANPWVLGGIALIGALDFVGDKIPGVDHLLHVVGGLVNTVAGAILFASQTGVADLPPAMSMALGLIVAGGVHGTKAAIRPVATGTTAGLGNPLVSFVEDGVSLLMSILAVFLPILAVIMMVVILVMAYRMWIRIKERPRKRVT